MSRPRKNTNKKVTQLFTIDPILLDYMKAAAQEHNISLSAVLETGMMQALGLDQSDLNPIEQKPPSETLEIIQPLNSTVQSTGNTILFDGLSPQEFQAKIKREIEENGGKSPYA